MSELNREEIISAIESLAPWRLAGEELVAEYAFADFARAMQFVNAVAAIAEELDHHPDIDIRYNKVRLAVLSHDVGRITRRDLRLAERVQALPAN